MIRTRLPRTLGIVGLVVATTLAGCTWRRVGQEEGPSPDTSVPQLFDAISVYRHMGLLAQGAGLPFVATVRFLAGPAPDSTLAVFGISMANNAFSFGHTARGFHAEYQVNVDFDQNGHIVGRIRALDTVWVATFKETLQSVQSIVAQHAMVVPPGKTNVRVTVRDASAATISGADERTIDVPRFGPHAISSLVAVYDDSARTALDSAPRFAINPRAMVRYAADTLRFYLEGYGLAHGTMASVEALSQSGTIVWRGTVPFSPFGALSAASIAIPPDSLPIGELQVVAAVNGVPDTVSIPALVSFSGQWVTANLDEVLSMLRYFGYTNQIDSIKNATGAERLELWRKFWKETDPVIVTPQNEALDEYFTRLEIANRRYQEGDLAGWLTDRGRVFITLGEPSDVYDASSIVQAGVRLIRWSYTPYRITLDFVDRSGFGNFRLTPASEAAYARVLDRLRRAEG